MATSKKIETVKKLTDKISRAKSLILADYRGLKHKQLEELRRLLSKVEAELIVAKNRLLLRAFRQVQGETLGNKDKEIQASLKETTAALFAYADEVAPLKEMLKYFKAAGFGKPKAGLLGSQFLDEADVARLSSLPAREVLLTQLVGQLNAPVQGLHYALGWNIHKLAWALNGVKEKKEVT